MLTHVDDKNNPSMVDISEKKETVRSATAKSIVFLPQELTPYFEEDEINSKKGPVLKTAIIAGTSAVKKTWDTIPFCHPIPIESIKFQINRVDNQHLEIFCSVKTTSKTGIEIEALNGAQVAALTVYDMCKAVTKGIIIKEVKLLEKKGGKSDFSSI